MKKKLAYLTSGALLLICFLPTLVTSKAISSIPTITLRPGDSYYDLPPITLSTTTPVPDKVIGYAVIPAAYERDGRIVLQETNAGDTSAHSKIGGSRQVKYSVKLSKNLRKGAYFFIIPKTIANPNGDGSNHIVKIIIK